MLDENIPIAVAEMLRHEGHQAEYIRDFVPPGAPDPIVATIAEQLNAVLVSFDSDFNKIAPRIPDGQRARFRRLCRIWLRETEPQAAERLRYALEFVEREYDIALAAVDQRMLLHIGSSYLRSNR